jgi:hypothetical protein
MTCQSVLAVWNKYGTLATSRKQQPFFISDIGSVCTRDEYAMVDDAPGVAVVEILALEVMSGIFLCL